MNEYILTVATEEKEAQQYFKTREEALTAYNAAVECAQCVATVDTLIELYRFNLLEFGYELIPIKSKFIFIR